MREKDRNNEVPPEWMLLERSNTIVANEAGRRSSVQFGIREGDTIENTYIQLKGFSYVPRMSEVNVIQNAALHIREQVEWYGWDSDTAHPLDKDTYEHGEALGQCMVTARLAKNYFEGSRVAEVQVAQANGEIVGPHVVLEIDSEKGPGYLDLTPDQVCAIGDFSKVMREVRPMESKVNFWLKRDPRCPYIFVRHQSDEELRGKKSKPLDHARLLMEKVAFRNMQPIHTGIERYCVEIPWNNLDSIKNAELTTKIESCTTAAAASATQRIKIGLVEEKAFQPKNQWLWEVLGLGGFDEVFVLNRGVIQQYYKHSNGQIVLLNFEGHYGIDTLNTIGTRLGVQGDTVRPVYAPTLLEKLTRKRGWNGPILVNELPTLPRSANPR